jgi:16S rRNA (cytosine1402-N4)-methyltransferase
MTNLEIPRHYSAFRGEITKLFELKSGKIFLDLTLGDGGHTEEALDAGCQVISFDVDSEAIERAIHFVGTKYNPIVIEGSGLPGSISSDFKWLIIHSNFTNVSDIFSKLNLPKLDGIMVDLGPSQYQVLSNERGFSFLSDQPLDMRLDKNLGVTAKDLVNALNEGELANLFLMADESWAKPIAKAIVKERSQRPIETTKQLASLISSVKRGNQGRIHPATQVFMALRMAVNLEREVIETLLPQTPNLLSKDGILGVISFHSGEDRLVKDFVKTMEDENILSAINKKPIEPTTIELQISQRTRSAKLRLARKNN